MVGRGFVVDEVFVFVVGLCGFGLLFGFCCVVCGFFCFRRWCGGFFMCGFLCVGNFLFVVERYSGICGKGFCFVSVDGDS